MRSEASGAVAPMGVLSELGHAVKPANAAQRVTQRLGASRPGSWMFQKTLYAIDRPLFRMSKGRLSGPGLLASIPATPPIASGPATA